MNDDLNQTTQPPLDDLKQVVAYMDVVSASNTWNKIGIFIDEGPKNVLILMLQDQQIVSMLRVFLSVSDSKSAIEHLTKGQHEIIYRCYQGENFTRDDIDAISRVQNLWELAKGQEMTLDLQTTVEELFYKIEKDVRDDGRGDSFTVETKRKVMLASHGRCMFTGCGDNLGLENVTGTNGNFSYLAHNVGSSESKKNSARAIPVMSDALSDEPSNILLLCDKHHRLVDRVAATDYPAHKLSEMRRIFCETADKLLEGLSYHPVQVFGIFWPVHRQVVSAPTRQQIAQTLAPIKCRMESQLNDLSDNESLLRTCDPAITNKLLIQSIETLAQKLLMQTHHSRYNTGLYAFGLMPPLIALGALLGNKTRITPMLRYRDSGQWLWPLEQPAGEFYDVLGLDQLVRAEEVSISLSLTADPESIIKKREELQKSGVPSIVIKARPEYEGNGALGHPEDGYRFCSAVQKLLHQLSNDWGVKRVHVLPCASNAACIFFGQAFDSHHPELLVYDFNQVKQLVPFLWIRNQENSCRVLDYTKN